MFPMSTLAVLPYGLAVRIPGFHPGGPGSTPGMGNARDFNEPHTPCPETSKAAFPLQPTIIAFVSKYQETQLACSTSKTLSPFIQTA